MIPWWRIFGVGCFTNFPARNRTATKGHERFGDLRRVRPPIGVERRRNQRLVPVAAQLDVCTGEIVQRREIWCPTIIRPDDSGVGWRGPIDIGAAVGTEDNLR